MIQDDRISGEEKIFCEDNPAAIGRLDRSSSLCTQVRPGMRRTGLTVKDPPMLQAARLEDYSPEYWALTAARGAAVLNMLRNVVGDDNFKKGLRVFLENFRNDIMDDDPREMT